ncbi:MAG: hybrid sensor histidine kinase/response regulator [Bdellovibrionota bacterium]
MNLLLYIIFGLLLGVPIGLVYILKPSASLVYLLLSLNTLAWLTAILMLISRNNIIRNVKLSLNLGGSDSRLSLEDLSRVLEQSRKELDISSLAIATSRIASKGELSETLQLIATCAQKALNAISVEILLHESESDHYHSAFIATQQRIKFTTADFSEIKESISFAGSRVGTIVYKFHASQEVGVNEKRLIQLISMQAGIAVLNEQFTGEILKLQSVSDEAKRARTGFLANLSHEIRGPLGNILNCIEITLEELCGPILDKQREALSLARNNGEHLLELINDVLDFAKIQSGRMNSKPEAIKTQDLLESVTKLVRSQAQKKHHNVDVRENSVQAAFTCDKRQIRQILINLLTNAIKYTTDGGTIEVWAEKTQRNTIRLNVKDNGIGISEADKPKVFSAFDRIETGYASEQLGTGLGMSLTQSLVSLNAGNIGFDSEINKGSHFWVEFPETSINDVKPEQVVVLTAKPGSGEKILVLENDDNERKMLSKYLNHVGYDVLASDNLEQVNLNDKNLDLKLLIISDKFIEQLPNIESLLAEGSGSKTPIILLSSHAFTQDVEHFIKLGVDRCLSKPVPLTQLGASCRSLIDESAKMS